MSEASALVETPAKRPIRLVRALLIGIGLVATLTLATSVLAARADPAISGTVYLVGSCPGEDGDLTGAAVTVTSSTGQIVSAPLGPPTYSDGGGGFVQIPTCNYDFEIQDRIPGATLTFKFQGCAITYTSGYLRDEYPMVGLHSWECTHGGSG